MKKGITPIIAIIILLMITIGLAALAWTYLSGFLTGYTKTLALVDFYCTGTTTANVILRNSGVEPLVLGTACENPFSGTTVTCGSLTITRTDGGSFNGATINPPSGTLAPRATLTFTDPGCRTGDQAVVCTYRFVTGGTGATVVSVPCG